MLVHSMRNVYMHLTISIIRDPFVFCLPDEAYSPGWTQPPRKRKYFT